MLDALLSGARAGQSGVLVLRGEAGVGKTALLEYVVGRAADAQVVRAVGVESELELAFSSLHQVCHPLLGHLDVLPAPQRDALSVVFGLSSGEAPDRFMVGLATLTLLAEAAETEALVCVVDDGQWLDRASAQILGFAARRLLAERVAFVCAARSGVGDATLSGLPELVVPGLPEKEAWTLLLNNVHTPLDAAVGAQIIAECHGNPLALLELPRTLTAADFAGGFGVPDSRDVPERIEASYSRRLSQFPAECRLLVLAAAAEPLGNLAVLHQAAGSLGVDVSSLRVAEDAGLLTLGGRVEFAHPLIRSAAYGAATLEDRRRVHDALALATDAEAEPDRRAWHLAQAAAGPDEAVARELERSADRARARGGAAAAAAFLQRAVELTTDPVLKAERALAAAEACVQAAAFDRARAVLSVTETGPLDQVQRARIHLMRGRIASALSYGAAAAELVKAAQELEPLDGALARATYLQAWGAALAAGELATEVTLRDVSRAALGAAEPPAPSTANLLLDGLALYTSEGLEAAAPTLRRAVDALVNEGDLLTWGVLAAEAAFALWDIDAFNIIGVRTVEQVRQAGALGVLATTLQGAALVENWNGRFRRASALVAEAEVVTAATGVHISPYGGMLLAAYQAQDSETDLWPAAIENATAHGEGLGIQYAQWCHAIHANSLGRYDEAMASARQASDAAPGMFVSDWALAELVESATRTGHTEDALEASARLTQDTRACETDWGLGLAARCRALASGDDADRWYNDAIERFTRTPLRPELARSHLLYGEWLRREGRRHDAREKLRVSFKLFEHMGMAAFAERARRELVAAGEKTQARPTEKSDELTPQETQIALLAREGLGNREIGTQLFLSPRTIEWHLRHVFMKLGITSRNQLVRALPDSR